MSKPLLLTLLCLFTLSTAFASFPVEKKKLEVENVTVADSQEDAELALDVVDEPISPAVASNGYNMWVAAALCWFLGIVAAHRWYAKKPVGINILFILTLGGLAVWWLIDLIRIFTGDFES